MDPDEFLAWQKGEMRRRARRRLTLAWLGFAIILVFTALLVLFGIWTLGGLENIRVIPE